MRACLSNSYWHHHGTFLNIRTAVRPLDDVCKSDKEALNFVIRQSGTKPVLWAVLYCHYVIKELVHAFSCAYIELWMHLGSLESTQEDTVALGYASSNSCTLLSCSPNFPRASITRYTHAKHEPILKLISMVIAKDNNKAVNTFSICF